MLLVVAITDDPPEYQVHFGNFTAFAKVKRTQCGAFTKELHVMKARNSAQNWKD
jgi:hypothetical protein